MEEGSTFKEQLSGRIWMESFQYMVEEHFHNNSIEQLDFKTLGELVCFAPLGYMFICQIDEKPWPIIAYAITPLPHSVCWEP